MKFGPGQQQNPEDNKHGTVGDVNYIYQRIAFTHHFFDLGSVKYTRYPKENTDGEPKKHQYYA